MIRFGSYCLILRLVFAILALTPMDTSISRATGAEPPEIDADLQELLDQAAAIREKNWKAAWNGTPQSGVSDEATTRLTVYYRALYPFQSLRELLVYEKELSPNRPQPQLNPTALRRLEDYERPTGWLESRTAFAQYGRPKSLAMLHSDQVRQFISQQGFGIQRFGPPRPEWLAITEVGSVDFAKGPTLSAEDLEGELVELLQIEPDVNELVTDEPARNSSLPRARMDYAERTRIAQDKYREWVPRNNPRSLPTLPRLTRLHDTSWRMFASRRNNGYIVNLDTVAGFMPHAVTERQRINMQKPLADADGLTFTVDDELEQSQLPEDEWVSLWHIRRMNLVSLLKHEEPRVYQTDHLPSMQEARNSPTRPPNRFEDSALTRLRAGEDIVVEARVNRILMLGAIRASKHCLECHSVQRGELLGAFSYELIRAKLLREATTLAAILPSRE